MVTCEVCGGDNFEKHAGFLYCATCQTQSQEYLEQEYEFQEANIVRLSKSKKIREKQRNQIIYDDGFWTSLEAFNYIIYGMTQELKKCHVTSDFEAAVFKLWAAYLRECNAGFISKFKEGIPKLGFCFKKRDARILYNIEVPSSISRDRRQSRSCNSKLSNTSNSSLSSCSRRSHVRQRNKIIADDYEEYLSISGVSNSNLADETLESLGKSTDLETSDQSLDGNESFVKSFKKMLSRKDYHLYKRVKKSQMLMINAKNRAKKNIRFLSKNKLLSIIHLALLMTGSQIQLSDLLRFIREGHVSFAKVTHFFPSHVKFPKNDFSYIDVISDSLMPTHLRQRKISAQLAQLLKIDKIFSPNMNLLVERYCHELNLPEQIMEFCQQILENCIPRSFIPTSKGFLPSYEAWAVGSIIFVLKLLFGLNDKTEFFLSHLAREVNRMRKDSRHSLFVFEDWQRHLECRKTMLATFHYPTEEQLRGNSFQSSNKFLGALMKESKDDHRSERFFPYPKYYMEKELLDGVKQMLSAMSKPHSVAPMEFYPSITPQISYLKIINNAHSIRNEECFAGNDREGTALSENISMENFEKCDVKFAFDPRMYLELIDKDRWASFQKFGINIEWTLLDSFRSGCSKSNLLLGCSSKYWVLEYPRVASGLLGNFKTEVFDKTPENFQWLIVECARMVEMNVRDIYDQLLWLEKQITMRN